MFWKLYFGLMGLLVVGSVGQILFDGAHPIYADADYVVLALALAQLVGLYGYAFKRPILSERFWRLAFPVFVFNLLATLLIGGVRFAAAQGDVGVPAATIFASFIGLPLFLPLLIGNRRYAFRSPEIWRETE